MFDLGALHVILLVEPCKIFPVKTRKILIKINAVPSKQSDSDF